MGDVMLLSKFSEIAQVTNKALAKAFANGMSYFNTFGGATAAGAAGLATLKVIKEEKLMQNAERVGAHLLQRFHALQKVGARYAAALSKTAKQFFSVLWV